LIIYTKQGDRRDLPYLHAYEGGVYVFQFIGDETYIDPYDSSVWNWDGVDNSIDEVLGVTQDDGRQLAIATSLNDCKSLQGSFFWDDMNGYLHVNWFESDGDWSISRIASSYSVLIAGYASKYNETSKNVFDGVYYDTIINKISGLSKKVDPTKFGLISFTGSSITYANEDGAFDNLEESQVVGVPIWFYFVEEDATELTNKDRVFTGFYDGYKRNESEITFDIIETRLFENKPVCPNSVTLSDYPNAGDMEGKTIPTAWGDIRRGIVLPINLNSLTEASSGTAQFLLADPSLYAIKAVTKLYDKNENELTIDSINLTTCIIEYTKPAGVAPNDLKDYKWEGQGYVIDDTYNNGLDIIKAAFLSLANIPFISSTYNIPEYNQGIIDNPDPVGLSVATDRGFIEEIIESVTSSVQGIVDIQGDGRITWRSRDITSPVSETIEQNDQSADVIVSVSPKETVSELTINYSPDFTDKDKPLTFTYSDDKGQVIGNYGINRKDPISPVNTILYNKSDAESTAAEIMSTSNHPARELTFDNVILIKSIKLFDIIGVDSGRFEQENFEYGEVLSIVPDYFKNTQKYIIRTIDDPVFRDTPTNGPIFDDWIFNDHVFGPGENEFNEGEL
jgi:hypothetical protein